jgi:hypothetical protein
MLRSEVDYPAHLDEDSKSIVKGLLTVEENERLSVDSLRKHKFFASIDWDKLGQKHVIPPFLPTPKEYPTKTSYSSFDSMLDQLSKARQQSGQYDVDWKEGVAETDQQLFNTWDFVSPHTLKVEMGIAGEMEAHDTNFKVQQIMGAGSVEASPAMEGRGIMDSIKSITPIEQGRKLIKRMSQGHVDAMT